MDFVNGKEKSTLDNHAFNHGYTSPEDYLNDARNFLEKNLLQLHNHLYLKQEHILDTIQKQTNLV